MGDDFSNSIPVSDKDSSSILTAKTVKLLMSLGLKINEAKIFFAMSQLGTAKVKTISQFSEVAREIVYQTLPSLVKKGLIEEVMSSPKEFRAIPLKEAYETLHQQKEEENRRLYFRYKALLKKQQNITQSEPKAGQITLLSSYNSKQSRIENEFKYVQESLDLTFPVGKFLQWCQFYAERRLKEVVGRKVRIRVITEKRLEELLATYSDSFLSPYLASLMEHVDFKFVQNLTPIEMMIFDNKTLFLSLKNVTNINKMQWLYSNNPFLVQMAKSHFETIWKDDIE